MPRRFVGHPSNPGREVFLWNTPKSKPLLWLSNSFSNLKSLNLCKKVFGDGPSDQYILELAEECLSLEVVNIEEEEDMHEGVVFTQAIHLGRNAAASPSVFITERRLVRLPFWNQGSLPVDCSVLVLV